MKIEFDPQKNAANFEKHGLRFEDAEILLDWDTAIFKNDLRKDYGEVRTNAFVTGWDGKPYNVVLTRRKNTIRLISFRRAGERERKYYEGSN